MSGLRQRTGLRHLVLPADLAGRIEADARRTPNVEVCGLLGGHGERVVSAYPVTNVSPTPASAFFMDPQGQLNAMREMDRSGEAMLAIYHSHPRTVAEPSPRDLAGAAYPGLAYVIVSLVPDASPSIAAFAFDGGRFERMRLDVPPVTAATR